jgi:type I restriction enzyme S subunit
MGEPSHLKRDQEPHVPSNRYLQDGDVLIVNTWQNLGRVCFVERAEPNWTVDSQIMIVRPRDRNLGKVLFHFLNSRAGYNLLLSCERGALTQNESRKLTHIHPKDIGKLLVPILDDATLASTAHEIQYAQGVAENVERIATSTKANFDKLEEAILSRAFSGELVPQDPNDEPASELLARLRENNRSPAKDIASLAP